MHISMAPSDQQECHVRKELGTRVHFFCIHMHIYTYCESGNKGHKGLIPPFCSCIYREHDSAKPELVCPRVYRQKIRETWMECQHLRVICFVCIHTPNVIRSTRNDFASNICSVYRFCYLKPVSPLFAFSVALCLKITTTKHLDDCVLLPVLHHQQLACLASVSSPSVCAQCHFSYPSRPPKN